MSEPLRPRSRSPSGTAAEGSCATDAGAAGESRANAGIVAQEAIECCTQRLDARFRQTKPWDHVAFAGVVRFFCVSQMRHGGILQKDTR